jgi:hypothetical protein
VTHDASLPSQVVEQDASQSLSQYPEQLKLGGLAVHFVLQLASQVSEQLTLALTVHMASHCAWKFTGVHWAEQPPVTSTWHSSRLAAKVHAEWHGFDWASADDDTRRTGAATRPTKKRDRDERMVLSPSRSQRTLCEATPSRSKDCTRLFTVRPPGLGREHDESTIEAPDVWRLGRLACA